jgi:hypothetical protein
LATCSKPSISYSASYSGRRYGSIFWARSPGRKPSFARLDRRAHQQDAAHLLALQRVDGAGHGQVGLAGTGRADAEVDVVAEDFLHVALLIQAARANHALLRAQGHAGLAAGLFQFSTADSCRYRCTVSGDSSVALVSR